MKKFYLTLLMAIVECTWLYADQVIVSMKQETKYNVSTMNIEYNDAGLISKIVYQDDESFMEVQECSYDSGSFLIKETVKEGGETYQGQYTGTLSNGRLSKISVNYYDFEYNFSELSYDQEGHLTGIVDNGDDELSTIYFTWADGNITNYKEYDENNKLVFDVNLTYGNTCNDLMLKWMAFFDYDLGDGGFWMFPFLGTPPRMLPIERNEQEKGSEVKKTTFQFENDSNGLITAIKKYRNGELRSTITITWGERQSASVDNVVAEKKANSATYSLEGYKARPGQKGIVISNGRKIVR